VTKACTWPTIESAPRDGSTILLRFGQDGVSQGRYNFSHDRAGHPWEFIDGDNAKWIVNHAVDGPGGPSHWMPMQTAAQVDDIALQYARDVIALTVRSFGAAAIHYPQCWDTAAYPTVESALSEVYAGFRCSAGHCGESVASDAVPLPGNTVAEIAEWQRAADRIGHFLKAWDWKGFGNRTIATCADSPDSIVSIEPKDLQALLNRAGATT